MIEDIIDALQENQRNALIDATPIDITECFTGAYSTPCSYGNISKNRVLAYIVRYSTLSDKYQKDESGRVIFKHGEPVIAPFGPEKKALACLCIRDIRNTSLHEIKDALQALPTIQGYSQNNLDCIEQILTKERPPFDPESDTAFIFAGKPQAVRTRLALNAYWFKEITKYGSSMLDNMTAYEARLMRKIFPHQVLQGNTEAIQKRSYMWKRPLYTTESTEFLSRKVATYRSFQDE